MSKNGSCKLHIYKTAIFKMSQITEEKLAYPCSTQLSISTNFINIGHSNFKIKTIILDRKAKAKTRWAGTFAGIHSVYGSRFGHFSPLLNRGII